MGTAREMFKRLPSIRNASAPAPPPSGTRGIFGGGGEQTEGSDAITNVIQKINISTLGAATDFGDLTLERSASGAVSNGANDRGVFAGGWNEEAESDSTCIMDYVTISSGGMATSFGDLYKEPNDPDCNRTQAMFSCSNGTDERGVFAGGVAWDAGGFWNVIQYITINTTGNAANFGDLTLRLNGEAGGTSNQTGNRGVFFGGREHMAAQVNVIQYITINTTGNATNFGDLLGATETGAACSNGTNNRGIFGGGFNADAGEFNIICYVTINTTGDATDFGDLSDGQDYLAATDNATAGRGVFAGGYESSPYSNTIQYITIASIGNSADFGDLINNVRSPAACSNS